MNNKLNFEYKLSGNQKAVLLNFILGNMNSRDAGKEIGLSHQQIINMTTNLFRSWVKSKKIRLNPDRLFETNNKTPNENK